MFFLTHETHSFLIALIEIEKNILKMHVFSHSMDLKMRFSVGPIVSIRSIKIRDFFQLIE